MDLHNLLETLYPQKNRTSVIGIPVEATGLLSGAASEELKIPGYDGTLIPLSVVHRKTVQLDGSNPLLMYGHGAYGITADPDFNPMRLAWIELVGIYAVAHVRGGGEYGEEW